MSEINITPMKVGVIGTGMICRIYIENIAKRFSVVELAAVADRNIEKAQEVADQFGVRACTVEGSRKPMACTALRISTERSMDSKVAGVICSCDKGNLLSDQ